ncbi:MAG: ATP-binding protein [Chitinophagales bacterium]|nr:ATP-binding protein [Chitinophagales bacterium]MDW8419041.1 ATP-binding protein [Chitinophagales bacterium]
MGQVSNLSVTEAEAVYERKVRDNYQNPVLSVYNNLLDLGTDAVEHHNQQKYIRVTNFITINTLVGSLIYSSLAVYWENWTWFFLTLTLGFTCLLILVFNAFGKTNLSRFTYLFAVNAIVFVNALYVGPGAEIKDFFVVSSIVPFLVYELKQFTTIAVGLMIPLIFIYTYDFLAPVFQTYYLPETQQALLATMGPLVQLVLTVAGVYQLVRLNEKTEKELENSNAQLQMQATELRRSNSDLEQFAYIISHDLKAPVRNISSFMNLLVNKHAGQLTPEAREFVTYSHTGAKRLERLIDDVLAYCRIGTNLPKPVPVNINDVINTIRFELREKLNSANATIIINRELPVVNNVHASLMYHIFQNLISNGLKFNRSANPSIEINWTNSLNYYTFSVKDNGIGISKEYSTTIFQMFKRLHSEQEYDGTGIGLAICKKIVEYYHGEIWFESAENQGTTFYFTIRKF